MRPAIPPPVDVLLLWAWLLSAPASAAHTDSEPIAGRFSEPSSLVRLFVDEVWNDKRSERIESYIAEACIVSVPGAEEMVCNPEWVRERLESCLEVLPDLRIEIVELLSSGDQVAIRWLASGSLTGKLAGLQGDGRRTTLAGATLLQLCDRKIVRVWCLFDRTAIYRDLGVPCCSSPLEPVARRGLEAGRIAGTGCIAAQVLDDDGQPLAWTTIEFAGARTEAQRMARSDGRFRLCNVVPGLHDLKAYRVG